MTRPTTDGLYILLHGPPVARNMTEPCHSCADYGPDEVEYGDGSRRGFCQISRERVRLYSGIRAITIPPDAIAPCWRARG